MLAKMVNGAKVTCSQEEEAEILAEWAENDRPRTPQEIDDVLEAEVQRDLNLSPKMKVILKQLFLIRKAADPSLTHAVFFAELKADYKIFKDQ